MYRTHDINAGTFCNQIIEGQNLISIVNLTILLLLVTCAFTFVSRKNINQVGYGNHTWIKNPPDNMEAIIITEAKVAAFFTSMNAAPIVRPRPCNDKN